MDETETIEAEVDAPAFPVEAIANGYVLTWVDGQKQFFKDTPELVNAITEDLHKRIKEQRHHEWGGKFTLRFGFKVKP